MFKEYYRLAKPGIIYGNAVAAIAGFFLAEKGHFDFVLFVAMLVGLSLVIGGGCVFNNYIDSDIDAKMERTKKRALVRGVIPKCNALIFGIVLSLSGALILGFGTNLLTLGIALLGLVFYAGIYTYSKRRTIYGTELGSISGAVPPVVGYCAVTNRFDTGAIILFLILVFWQMPHFYAIAINRREDYEAAKVPVLPVAKGIYRTKINIVLYIIGFIVAAASLKIYGYAGNVYLAIAMLLGLIWLGLSIRGFKNGNNDKIWGKQIFFYSLIVLLVMSAAISADAWIH